ncbi:hypothetical protein ACS0TY_017772 [Phlomoides rotata]
MIFVSKVRMIMAMLWGGEIEGEERERLGDEFREKVTKFVDLLGRANVSDYFPGLGKFDLQGIVREMKGVAPGIEEILDSLIEGRMKKERGRGEENRKKDFLEILLELKGRKHHRLAPSSSPSPSSHSLCFWICTLFSFFCIKIEYDGPWIDVRNIVI